MAGTRRLKDANDRLLIPIGVGQLTGGSNGMILVRTGGIWVPTTFGTFMDGQTVIGPLNGSTDRVPIITGANATRIAPAYRVAQATAVAIDPVPVETGTIDTTGTPPDGKVIRVESTADISTILIDEGITYVFEFVNSGGKLVNSAGLALPGGVDIVRAAGDRLEAYGVSGGMKVVGYTRKSGVAVKSTYVRVFTIAPGPIDIANDLNHLDGLNGMTLETGKDVLVPFQADPKENGLWRAGATPTRTPGFESVDSFQGVLIDVVAGDYGEGTVWTLATTEGVIGTTDLSFALVVAGYARAQKLDDSIIHYRPVIPKTSDHTVLITENRTIFTNLGATGTVRFTLPSNASCTAGKTRFKFIRLTVQDLELEPASGNIYGYNSAQSQTVNATNGSPTVAATDIGEWIEVTYMGSDIWHAELNGRWT